MEKTFYTVKMDSRFPYALVLKQGSTRAEKYEGYESTDELHQHMKQTFGPDVKRLAGLNFQALLLRRQVHTPEVLSLLKRDGDLLGQDLTHCFVYGSYNRPMDSIWARIDHAVYIRSDKYQTGYHTYVAVPGLLDDEVLERYELQFVSRPAEKEKAS